jgi:hypothetical protein
VHVPTLALGGIVCETDANPRRFSVGGYGSNIVSLRCVKVVNFDDFTGASFICILQVNGSVIVALRWIPSFVYVIRKY